MSIENYMLKENNYDRIKNIGLEENGKVSKLFENIYKYYACYLLQYLDKKLELSTKEEIFENSVQAKPVKGEEQDGYQALSPLKFFYIRNNLKIERLPKEYIELLKRRIFSQKKELDEKTEQMIEETYQTIIKNEKYQDGTKISYGPTTSIDFFAPNNALVLGFRFDPEYEKDNGENHEWLEQYVQKERLAKEICSQVREKGEKEALLLSVIEYNEETIEKKEDQQQDDLTFLL